MLRKTLILPFLVLLGGLPPAFPLETAAEGAQSDSASAMQVSAPPNQPRHPADASGPKHTVTGVIRGVKCSFPTVIEFRLVGPSKPISLYNNNFANIDLSVLGFDLPDSVNPCKVFEGKKAEIQYAESSDKTVDGKVFAVELIK